MSVLKDISRIMRDVRSNMTAAEFGRAAAFLDNSKNNTRERIQKVSSSEINPIINKLEKNQPLTSEDLECIKLWIVGDAEGYTEMENNFNDWLKEFDRMIEVLSKYENKELSINELVKVSGLLEDALRNSLDIMNFLEKKERIERFNEATKDASSLDREVLVKFLRAKISSSKM